MEGGVEGIFSWMDASGDGEITFEGNDCTQAIPGRLLRHGAVPAQTLQLDDDTRSCSFRPQRTIASFFGAAPAAKAARRE